MSEVELRRPLLLLTPCAWESKAALGLSWAPWSGSEENLQALFYWYLDFLLAEDLYIVHLLNVINSLPLLSPSCPHYTWYHDSDWLPRWQRFNPGGTGKGTSEYMCIYIYIYMPVQEPTRTPTSKWVIKKTGITTENKLIEPNYLYSCRHNIKRLCWKWSSSTRTSSGRLWKENWVIMQRQFSYLSAIYRLGI